MSWCDNHRDPPFFNRLQFGKPRSFVTMGFPQISSLIQLNTHACYESWAQSRWLHKAKKRRARAKPKGKCRCNNTACRTTIEAVSMAETGKDGELWVRKEENKPSTHRGVIGVVVRERAKSSVGTCALSKLLSRHKLLVSDQLLSSQNLIGYGIDSL